MSDERFNRGPGRRRARRGRDNNYGSMPPQNNFRWKEPQSFESESWRDIRTNSSFKRGGRKTGGYINHHHYGTVDTGENWQPDSSYKNYNRHNGKETERNNNPFGKRQNHQGNHQGNHHQAKANSRYPDNTEIGEEAPTPSSTASKEPIESEDSKFKIKIPETPKTPKKMVQSEDTSSDSSPEKEEPPKQAEEVTKETPIPKLNVEIKKEPKKGGRRKDKRHNGTDNASEDRHSDKVGKEKVQSEDSSSDSSSEDEEPQKPVKEVANKTPNANFKVKIKQEPIEKPVIDHPAEKSSSSAESSSSESSSSSDEEVPRMPPPLKHPLKHELSSEEEVSFVSHTPGDEAGSLIPCIVCNEQGHRPSDCNMECKKCSKKSSYELKAMCKNCGEVYHGPRQEPAEGAGNTVPRQDWGEGEENKSLPQPPNPFAMFMQFMQFCMSQYAVSPDIKYPFPQFESASAPVLGQTPTVEVTQKDIAKHKRKKSESKHRHRSKKARSMLSESSLKTTPTRSRPDVPAASTSQCSDPQQQNNPMLFGGQFPPGMVFPAPYNALGYNPMLAFSQMIGLNPARPMNFPNQM